MERSKLVDETVYTILVKIQSGATFKEVVSELGDDIHDEALEYCHLHKLINGLSTYRTADGALNIDATPLFGLTKDGEMFIKTYSR